MLDLGRTSALGQALKDKSVIAVMAYTSCLHTGPSGHSPAGV